MSVLPSIGELASTTLPHYGLGAFANVARLLAMTFGRPVMIADSYNVPLPCLIDDEYLSRDSEASQPAHTPSRLGLFVFSCRLFEILADILGSFYAAESRSGLEAGACVQDMVMQVLNFNSRLDEFMASVPDDLQPVTAQCSTSEREHHMNLQQQVLYCR
jgi:hypothetical protein